MNLPRQTTYGPLRCIVIDGPPTNRFPTAVIPVILCHGFGASGDDLAGLAQPTIDRLGEDAGAFRFIFPEAPIDLSDIGMFGGRAWWPINMGLLQERLQTNRFDQLHDIEPPGVVEARDQLTLSIAAMFADMPTPAERASAAPVAGVSRVSPTYVLGGFSQGAMLAMETALRGPAPPPKLLVEFSGTMICQSLWAEKLDRLKGTLVLQSHGRTDFILPFSSATVLRDFMVDGGVEVDFVPFDGPHTIPGEAIVAMVKQLSAMAGALTSTDHSAASDGSGATGGHASP